MSTDSLLDHARQLERMAAELRRLHKLMNAAEGRPPAGRPDADIRRLQAVARQLREVKAAELPKAASELARRSALPVLPVQIAARQLRAQAREQADRKRRLAVMRAVAQGQKYEEIAARHQISTKTVQRIVRRSLAERER